MRWQVVEEPREQGALFDEPIFEREPGRGEFRGMEFLHVRAQRIINELKGTGGYLPFRFTINAYRGCSHSCTYCMVGDTPVLMADGRPRALADLRPGDLVYGTVRVGTYRRYTPTPVLDHWSTVKSAYRITLEDGTQVVASGDHRFLTERGWKHVTGRMAGPGQRPHLTTNNDLLGFGAMAEPPKTDTDYQRGYLTGMIRGDGTVGSYPSGVHVARLALVDAEPLSRTAAYLADAGIETRSRVFSPATETHKQLDCIYTARQASVVAVRRLIVWPSWASDSWCKGFLAGIFDAEGSCSRGIFRISNKDPMIIGRVITCLRRLGFRCVVEGPNAIGVCTVRLLGGLRERMRFFLLCDPVITRKRTIDGLAMESDASLGVVAIEPLGVDLPMYDITTGTGDFIANGVVSHNCFARPTHAYLDLDIDRDFERRIVVKVNAVERLRIELDRRRWGGDHIAMGTNTDPYQRCEGKYRLTQGLVETLVEAGNPFSILTKSTLILRDLPLLAAAAQQGLVRVNLSIGTLDDEVWRTTEPGTPHPRRRVEAVRKLNDAGVPCGVLVAPVLPGLSDRADQLDDVVTACVEAGAVSISPVLLHLRPGVKDVYYDRLRANHPQLMPRYEHLYGDRSYAPKAEQRRVADLVHELVRRRQGRLQSFGETPMPGPSRGSSRAAPARADPGASDVPVQQSLL